MTPILKNNIQVYFILVNIVIGLIYSLSILLIIMSYRIKNKKLNVLWPISIFKFCLPFFSVFFFGQCFLLLTTIFDCQNGFAYVSKELICRTGIWFSIDGPLALIAMLLHFLIALITNSLYYKSTFVKKGSDVLKKTNCYPDIVLLFTKIFVIVLFILDDGKEEEHWTVLFFLILATGLNTLCNFFYQTRQNQKLNYLNNILCLLPFLGFSSLFIGKIFLFLGFNGSIFLFFSWFVFGIIFILFYKKKDMDFALINFKEIENPGDYLNYIHKFHNIILNKNNSRKDYTILKSLIAKKEEKCFDAQCPLKKYIENISNEIDDIFPLLQFCEKLFDFGISKFPNDISLKINYSMFLIFEMNNNKKALICLNNINASILSFLENYNIFRCQRLIDEYIMNKNKTKNVIPSIEYKNKVHDFKSLVSKVTSLYYDFWTLIIINKLNVTNNMDDLNKIGSEIIKLKKKIEEDYDILIKIRPDNYDLISFYSNFNENVLNSQEKFRKNKNKISKSVYNNFSDSQEIQFSNFDVNILKEKDLFKYMIVSGNDKNLANIIDFSSNLCHIFGYTKEEIIGKNINYLIPELFHKAHDKLLFEFNEKALTTFYKELYKNDNYIPEYLERTVNGISKSKYLIPIKMKIYFVQTEANEFVYIVELIKKKDFQQILEISEDSHLKCVVLTDENFYIQTFTPNSINYLQINDSYINANYNIINYIKQLKNQYLKKINEIVKIYTLNNTIKNYSFQENSEPKISYDNISYKEKKKIKKELLEQYFLEKHEIVWRINLSNNQKKNPADDSIFKHSLINHKDDNIYLMNNTNFYEEHFTMEIKKIIIFKELVGYYFIFYKEQKELHYINNFISFNVPTYNDRKRNSISKQRKYKYLFQEKPNAIKKKSTNLALEKQPNKVEICKSPKKYIKFKSYEKEEFNNFTKLVSENSSTHSNKTKSSKNMTLKYNTDINLDNIDNPKEQIAINENYIPECPFNFSFDFKNRTYKPCYDIKNEDMNNLKQILKLHALKKINNCKEFLKKQKETKEVHNEKNSESNESEDSENEEKESSFSETLKTNSQISNDIDEEPLKIQIKDSKKMKNQENNDNLLIRDKENNEIKNKNQNKNDIMNNYYKVNLSNIHLSIYDFNKDMIVDTEIEKISKVESIIKNNNTKIIEENKNSGEFPNILFNNIINVEKKKSNAFKTSYRNNQKEKVSDEKITENKILEAINKEQDEENMRTIHKYSFLLIFILFVLSGIFLYLEINFYSDIKTVLSIIKNIISINYCNKMGIYFVRELTLLNIPDTKIKGGQYDKIPANNKAEYISFVKKNILELFIESQNSMSDFFGTTFSISKNSDILLTQTKLVTRFSVQDRKSTIVKNNIIITIVQLNSAFYNLASSTSPVQQNHADLYTFMHNSLNNFGLAIDILIDTYRKELVLKIKSYQMKFQIQLLIYIFFYIIIYILALILFSKVIQRKKSYIQVFININFDFISMSISKCEQFINRFKLSKDNKMKEEEIDESLDERTSLILPEIIYKDPNIKLKRKSFNIISNNNKKKKHFKCTKNIIFQIFFGIFLLISYLIYFLYGFIYLLNLNKTAKYISNFYYHLQHYHLTIIDYYNIYREFLFDNGSIILNLTTYDNLVVREKAIYDKWTYDVNNITFYINYFINNNTLKEELYKSLCSYNITDYFKSEEDCINEVGNGYNQDINTFTYGFIDEIRIKKNMVKILIEKDKIYGNLSEYLTDTWYENYYDLLNNEYTEDSATKIRFRLDLFNEQYFHTISNIYFINIIFPCLNKHRKLIFDYLTIVGKQNVFYVLFFILILLFLIIYLFFWAPMIKKINKAIYETKNMLKIIPMHILIADSNIKNLLHISAKK